LVQKRLWNKIQELKERAPIGKKLKGNPYWSLRIHGFRIIYLLKKTSGVDRYSRTEEIL
jgi:mRNA-degrading endonuclease RelE of RelBE toxin-antitoxin system